MLAATLVRLYLAWRYHGNFDQESYEIVQGILRQGKCVYAETRRYNYSPVWFWCLGWLDVAGRIFAAPPQFVVRSFLTAVDLATAGLLYRIAKAEGKGSYIAPALYYANPVMVLQTGFHGQFENFAIFFLLAAIQLQIAGPLTKRARYAVGVLTAAGVLVKHIVLPLCPYVLARAFPRVWARLAAFAGVAVLFCLSFLPYVSSCGEGIRENVFGYSGLLGLYGLTSIFPALMFPPWILVHKAVLAAVLLGSGFFDDGEDLVRGSLVCVLLFLVLTPGISIQYFTMPLAFGALRVSPPYFLYSAAATGLILLAKVNIGSALYPEVLAKLPEPWNVMWLVSILWLLASFLISSNGNSKGEREHVSS